MQPHSDKKDCHFISVKFKNDSSIIRQIFIKQMNKNGVKSLILFNVPIICDAQTFKSFLEENFGGVSHLTFHSSLIDIFNSDMIENRNHSPLDDFRIAHVLFKKSSSFKKILNCNDTLTLFSKYFYL